MNWISTLSRLEWIVIGIIAGSFFLLGRYVSPEKVKIETKFVQVEQISKTKDVVIDRQKHKKTVIVEGNKSTTITEDETLAGNKTINFTSKTETTKDASKETLKSPGVNISALAGIKLFDFKDPVYGLSVNKQILGPVTAGVWGFNTLTFGVSLGLNI